MKNTSERREHTIALLKKNGSVQVTDLSKKFGVSTVTIRNDLAALEKQGIATRAYGGAYLQDGDIRLHEHSVEDKNQLNKVLKQKIAAAAVTLIEKGDTLILDSGTTTYYIAEALRNAHDLVVMTNGLNIANALFSAEGVEVMLTGGKLRRKSMSFYGIEADNILEHYHFNKLFLGVDGFNLEKGITTYNENEARLNRRMCNIADEVIVVTDSSKFGKVSLHKILETARVDKIVTDEGIPKEYLQGLEQLGITVIVVKQ
ncbi:DeoR family transcriptional regulator [Vibrio metschnikovii]|uniref:Transcriptional repressor AgaR n=2 Tax=Unclassified Bacteria TaxID=49928 RepID=A0AAU6TNQ5_UNCXX|nr:MULTISPECIES: transcriptional repressor AgaR [Vibrio]NAW61696.1 DeoR family transcriptional regulator [Vibrio sp. V31_P5A7T61]NAX01340.1 DeoR family transcriptional regulator [Vibrio sp. V34_P3A8T189]NAX09409.1 DeoR family transcriptional regulator [Vibrio sp. V40_P2S30T141]NAX62428.1 DeoR family transcriptional regulator [Vibrio sp. V32_P6A28T40]NNN60275.1 DeoR family transcriptional regulator [Vibrio sp. A11]